ncbi:uncharacterized protein ACNLHF_024745 [Anomaloglossus baeobatrachus]|uniref:uncharacterized protein LOC142246549 n=1 Tax=Anomaloglossus baeobatrachus TaxID=238106 RepID=UPI003F4FF759
MGKDSAKIIAKHLKRLCNADLDAFIVALCGVEAPRGCNKIQIKELKGKTAVEVADVIIGSYTVRHGPKKVIKGLKIINKNQIRIDLQKDLRGDKNVMKNPKTTKAGAPGTSSDKASGAGWKQNVKEKKVFKPTVTVQPMGANTGCEPGTSQQPGKQPKPKRGRKLKSDTKTTEISAVKAETSGGAVGGKRARKESGEKEEKPKRARKQSTSDKKHIVNEKRSKLINSVTHVDPVLDDLLEEELLTQEQYGIIRKKGTSQDKMRELYDYVISWGPKDNNRFFSILKKHNPVVIKNLKTNPK